MSERIIMKVLKFTYHMDIQFDMPVKDHHFTLKCLPHSGQGQLIESMHYEVYPNRYISRSTDSYKNECIYGFCEEEHDHFTVDVDGVARTGIKKTGVDSEDFPKSIYKYQTEHTMPGEAMQSYHDELLEKFDREREEQDVFDTEEMALFYMHCLFQDFTYETGSTVIETTAEKAFQLGRGVCQDYTHILLGLLRMEHIPCRYVTGMMEGEGFSHAWVEVYTEKGWLALDPTNDQRVTDGHIRISIGRDYRDCMLNQGIFIGCEGKAVQTQTIRVEVTEIG